MANSLVGVRVKIDRAIKHFGDLDTAVKAFMAREPYGFVIDIDSAARLRNLPLP